MSARYRGDLARRKDNPHLEKAAEETDSAEVLTMFTNVWTRTAATSNGRRGGSTASVDQVQESLAVVC